MTITLVGVQGHLAGRSFPISDRALTLGRGSGNDVVLAAPAASRVHAELRPGAQGCALEDLGSGNGTYVDGERVTVATLRPGDEVSIGDEVFRFEASDSPTVLVPAPVRSDGAATPPVLRVTVAGGGPVGMTFALLLDHLMGSRVAITVHDGRWARDGDRFIWQNPEMGNNRRQQVVTVQSRQFAKLPPEVQARLFQPGTYSEMWPTGPDSVQGQGPRNIRIAYIEDELLAMLDEPDAPDAAEPARLEPRLPGMPDDDTLRPHLAQLSPATVHTLVVSEPWDSGNVGGEEVDVDWLLPEPDASVSPSSSDGVRQVADFTPRTAGQRTPFGRWSRRLTTSAIQTGA